MPDNVDLLIGEIDSVDAAGSVVRLADGREIGYDYLVIATGVAPRADQTLGMLGPLWRRSIVDSYTLDGATALAGALERFDHGRLVVHVTEMPIKCPSRGRAGGPDMIENIVVAVDDSPPALAAARLAIGLAAALGSRITAVAVQHETAPTAHGAVTPPRRRRRRRPPCAPVRRGTCSQRRRAV